MDVRRGVVVEVETGMLVRTPVLGRGGWIVTRIINDSKVVLGLTIWRMWTARTVGRVAS